MQNQSNSYQGLQNGPSPPTGLQNLHRETGKAVVPVGREIGMGNEQFVKDEQTAGSTVRSAEMSAEMPLSTEVSLKTYLKSIVHTPRSLQVLQFPTTKGLPVVSSCHSLCPSSTDSIACSAPAGSVPDEPVLLDVAGLLLALLHRLRGSGRVPRGPDGARGHGCARGVRGGRAHGLPRHVALLAVLLRILAQHRASRQHVR